MVDELPHTGERYLPWLGDYATGYEHVHRYMLAVQYAHGKRVLDISCGEGYGTAMLATVAHSVIGIDIDAATVTHAHRYHGRDNTLFVRANAEQFAVAPQSIDLAVSFETIEHLEQHALFLTALEQALKRDGILIISTPNRRIYRDQTSVRNPFHVRELERTEFVETLGRYFRHVALFGQELIATSLIAGAPDGQFLAHDPQIRVHVTAFDDDVHEYPIDIPSTREPRYYVAICSNQALPSIENSLIIDNTAMLYRHFTEQSEKLRTALAALAAQRTCERDTTLIAGLRQTIEEQTLHLDDLHARLAIVEGYSDDWRQLVRSAHQQLLDRDSEIACLHTQLDLAAEKERHIANLEMMVTEKDRYITSLLRTLTDTREEFRHLDVTVAEKDRHITFLNGAITAKEQERASLGTMVAEKDQSLAALGAEIDKLVRERNATSAASEGLQRYAGYLEETIASKDQYIASLESTIPRFRPLAHLKRVFHDVTSRIGGKP